MDPYTPPASVPAGPAAAGKLGRPCVKCGSPNTGPEVALRHKPGILAVLLFGWLFLLIRGAFSKRTETCHDCGAVRRYKTSGSWLAMAVLLLFAVLLAMSCFIEPV